MSIKLEKDNIESEYNKIFLKYLKQYIDKSKMKGRITVRETEDQTKDYKIPEYILNTNPPVKIKIITNYPLGVTERYGPIHMSRVIYIILDMEPGHKRRKQDIHDSLATYYHIEQMDKDSVSEKISLSLNMVACDIIKDIAGFEDTEDIIETDFYDEADLFNKYINKSKDSEEEKTSDDESTETYEDYKKKNKRKWSIKDYIGKIMIILLGLALFMIPIAEAISGFYYYNKHEHNQPVKNIRTEEQIREEQQAYNDIISGKYRSVMDRLEATHQDHRIQNIQAQIERDKFRATEEARAIAEQEIKSGKYRSVMDRIEAIHQNHRIQNIKAYHENEIKSGKYKTVMDRIEATSQQKQTEGQNKKSWENIQNMMEIAEAAMDLAITIMNTTRV